MFCSQKLLVKKSGKKGVDRPQYLKELVEEFNTSQNRDAHEQVLANLANFAYDPLNYKWLLELGVIDIFLLQIVEGSGLLQQFAISGLCNLALDPNNKETIVRKGGISSVASLLTSNNENCVINAITTLMFLTSSQNEAEITNESIVNQMIQLSINDSPRIRNLATIFLNDYCLDAQVKEIRQSLV